MILKGGVIWFGGGTQGTAIIYNSTFSNNKAGVVGGVIHTIKPSSLFLYGNQFQKNTAGTAGVLNADGSSLNIKCNAFQENQAFSTLHDTSVDPGGVIKSKDSTIALYGNRFVNNSATDGASLYLESSSLDAKNNTFEGNFARSSNPYYYSDIGGVVVLSGSQAKFSYNIFTQNAAEGYGGAVYASDTSVDSIKNTFSGNRAGATQGEGGAYYFLSCSVYMDSDVFIGNLAPVSFQYNILLRQ